ncbi:hypothetical protein ACFQAT_13510 [Undibacterium arcticum]|uniref:6-phosphogluconate dehydrogenase n=1 Tax=Undibacterium arcticum TaxID=1762892 RepID=A0ABV7F1X2_9BURK
MPTSRRIIFIPLALTGAVLLLFAAYTWISLHWSYSNGERAGYMQKFSKKGWLCKTWEGELLLTTVPGAVPEKFIFTVRDDAVAQQLLANAGNRVVLTYAQHKGVPTSCLGETEYFIEKVQVVQ